MEDLNTTQGIVALAAAAAALLALVWLIVLSVKLRRVRTAQRMVLGGGDTDLVGHAQGLQEAFVQLRDWVEETAGSLEQRTQLAEQRIDGCVANTSLVRYDAYNEMSGRQSSSLALHRRGHLVHRPSRPGALLRQAGA